MDKSQEQPGDPAAFGSGSAEAGSAPPGAAGAAGERLRLILDSATDYAILTTDLDRRVTSWSAGAQATFGYRADEIVGRPADILFTPEDRAEGVPAQEVEGARRDGVAPDVRWHLRKDGSRVFVDGSVRLLRDRQGREAGFLKIARDETERRQLHEALHEAARRTTSQAAEQAAILDQLSEGVIVTDADGRIAFVNEAAERLHGVKLLDVAPDGYADTYHLFTETGEPHPPHDLPLARAVLRRETVTDARWRIRRPDGTEVLAIGNAKPILARDGSFQGAVLTVRDDTRRSGAESALRESEARLLALTDNLPAGMVYQVTTGPDGGDRRFLYLSQSNERLSGVPPQAVLDDPTVPYSMILPEDRPAMLAAEEAAIRNRSRLDVEVRFRHATTGEVRWSRVISEPREQPDGSLIWDGIQIDTTENKQAEEREKRRSRQLQQLAEAALVVARALTLEDTLEELTHAARRIIGAHQAVVSLTRGPDWSQAINAVALTSKYEPWRDYAAMPDGAGIYAWLCEENRSARFTQAELEAHPRWRGFGGHAAEHPPMRGWLAAPMVARDGRNLGLIQLSDKEEDGEFDAADEAMLVQLAQLASAAVEQAQTEAALRASEAELRRTNAQLAEESRTLETLNRTGAALAGELDGERVVQMVTDAGVALTGARFGAYFHNIMDDTGERLSLYTLSGAERADFEAFGHPRATPIFGPTFRNEGVIRSDDILADPRYGRNAPHKGMPEGHLPVRSYLAVSVVSRTGEVLGGLLFGHPEPGRFTERHERLMVGIAAQAAVAIDNARLFQAVQQARETLEGRVAERTAELGASERRFRGIFDSAFQFMALLEPDGTVIEVNQTALQWSEIGAEEIVGRPFWLAPLMRGDPALQSTIETAVRRAAGGETVRSDLELRGAGDMVATIDFSLKPVPGPGGGIGWLVAEGRDISELKSAQEALRQAQKMEAVGQLTGGVAHDFNNLLMAVLSSLALLRKRVPDDARLHQLIDNAVQGAERGAALTRRMLAFARKQELAAEPVDLARLAHDLTGLLERTLGPEWPVRLRLDENAPPVLADAHQVEMALLNMAVNARDAMAEGGEVVISLRQREVAEGQAGHGGLSPGRYAGLSVTDTGHGMDRETLARATEPFFTTKGVGKGTGLGLSMIHGLARQLGGDFTLHSEPGRGTTATLWLPVTEAETMAEPQRAGQPARPAPAGALKILAVDDDALVLLNTAALLEDLGHDVLEATGGDEALALIKRHPDIDLLITDQAMPGMSGAQLVEQISPIRPGLPIVLATGYGELPAGFARSMVKLNKPFGQDELRDAMVQALRRKDLEEKREPGSS